MTLPHSADPKDFPCYGKMDNDTYNLRKTNLLLPLYNFSASLDIEWDNVEFSQARINQIVDMVQRRAVYFHVFHGVEIGELNEACLNCFWIMKFSPFRLPENPSHNINVTFALGLFTRAVTYTAKKNGIKPNLTEEVIEHLEHAFSYRDLSKEALMAIAKSLAG